MAPTPIEQLPHQSLSQSVVKGVAWVFSLKIISRGLGFVKTIILARLLAPEDFGLLGIAMLAISTLETFSQTGFQAAIIQTNDDAEQYLDTAWTVSAIRGTLLFLILLFSAPMVASFFKSPDSASIIKVIAVSTLISGFTNIGILFFQKELDFKKQFFYELVPTLFNLSLAITLAFIMRDVWALVWGGLLGNFVQLLMSYILHPYRPSFRIAKNKFSELFAFGKWVLGSSILGFLVTQGDDIFVGKLLGVTALGIYQMAYLISNLPASEITHVISKVTFPAYSKLQNDLPRLKAAYLNVLQVTAFLSFPIAFLILVMSSDFTTLFLGEKWMPISPAIQILVFAGLTRSIAAASGYLFYAVGKPNIDTKLQIIRFVVLIVLIYPLTKSIGISGTSLAVLFSIFISNIGFSYMALKISKCGILPFSKMLIFPLILSSIAYLCIIMIKSLMEVRILEFSICILMFGIVYAILYICAAKFFNYTIGMTLKTPFKALRGI